MEKTKANGQPDKRRAIIAGALALFARDGYSRASLDAIAIEAGVSNRTIYNHFDDKADLFQAVIQESTQRVADRLTDIVDRHLSKATTNLESNLIDLGVDILGLLSSDLSSHFALIQQINADAEHIPQGTLELWRTTGPGRVRRHLGNKLQQTASHAGLTIDDPSRAAGHLLLLVSVENLDSPELLADKTAVDAMVSAGVRTFLRGYQRPNTPR